MCYFGIMGRRTVQGLSRLKAPYLRRATLVLLALTYLFVGLGHVPFCTEGAISVSLASELGAAPSDGSDNGGATKAPVLAEHCPVCTPAVMPTPVPMASQLEHPVKIVFVAPRRLLEEHPKLDTPPPKHLT